MNNYLLKERYRMEQITKPHCGARRIAYRIAAGIRRCLPSSRLAACLLE